MADSASITVDMQKPQTVWRIAQTAGRLLCRATKGSDTGVRHRAGSMVTVNDDHVHCPRRAVEQQPGQVGDEQRSYQVEWYGAKERPPLVCGTQTVWKGGITGRHR